jgi:hypothetical protein
MTRLWAREAAQTMHVLNILRQHCPARGSAMRYRCANWRAVVTLGGTLGLRLRIRRCENPECERHHRAYRPEPEGSLVLPQHEFGLDVLVLMGALRDQEHRSVPEIHAAPLQRGVAICVHSVTNCATAGRTHHCDSGQVHRQEPFMSPARKAKTGTRFLGLPAHWTPEQALAVFEILELLRDALCAAYGPEIQQAFRDDLMLEQGSLPLGPGEPF